jgi:hypothetical protein
MKVRTLQTNFIAGEFDEVARARTDTAMIRNGAASLLNCLPLATGGMLTRWGSRYIRQVTGRPEEGGDPPVRLLPFEFSRSQGYVVVCVPYYALVVDQATEALVQTLAAPWTAADLPLLRTAQLGDVMWITCAALPIPLELVRVGADSFTLGQMAFDGISGQPFFRYAPSRISAQTSGGSASSIITLGAAPQLGGVNRRPEPGTRGRANNGGAWKTFTVTSLDATGLVVGIVWDDPTTAFSTGVSVTTQFALFAIPAAPPETEPGGGGGGDGGGGGGE